MGSIANVLSGLTEQNRILTLRRERIELNLSPSRSLIAREYPDQADFERLDEVATLAIANTELADKRPQAFGYNIEMVFEQDTQQPAIYYLGERLFNYQALGKDDWKPLGGRG